MQIFRYWCSFCCLLIVLTAVSASANVDGQPLVFEHSVLPDSCNAVAYEQRLVETENKDGHIWADRLYNPRLAANNTQRDYFVAHNLSFSLKSYPVGDNNYVLPLLNRGLLRCVTGNYGLSFQYFLNAKQVMESLEQKGVTLGKEQTKIFKGEAYEHALASLYMGLLLYMKGDYDNARAMFAQAVELDRETLPVEQDLVKLSKQLARKIKDCDEQQARSLIEYFGNDNRLAYYMLARTYLKLGEAQNARISLQNAYNWKPVPMFLKKKSCGNFVGLVNACDIAPPEENPFVAMDRIENDNLVLLIQMGLAPKKTIGGMEGQKDYLCPTNYLERKAVVYVDGQYLCEAHPMFNLVHQAVSVPRTTKDTAQTGKAVGKFFVTVLVAAALGDDAGRAVNNAWSVAGDARRWGTAPNEIHLASGRVKPGLHTITVLFYDAQGKVLPHYEQTQYFVPVEKERFLLVRSLRDRCNTLHDFRGSRVTKFKEKKGEMTFYHKDLPGVKEGDELSLITIDFRDKAVQKTFMQMRTTKVREGWDDHFRGFRIEKAGDVRIVKMTKKDAIGKVIQGNPDPKQTYFVTNHPIPYPVISEFANSEIFGK